MPKVGILSIQLRLFHKRTDVLYQDVGNMLKALLPSEYSYWVPVVVHQDPLSHYTDVQYGAKPNLSFNRFWDAYKDTFSAIWGRYTDNEFCEDYIFFYHGEESWKKMPDDDDERIDTIYDHASACYYGFDQVTVYWREGFTPPDLGFTIESASRVWTLPLKGRYRAINDRSYVLLPDNSDRAMDTPTTPTLDNLTVRESEWGRYCPKPDIIKSFEAHKAGIEAVEFHWKGRLVHLMKPAPDKSQASNLIWQQWYLDHWDNCVDEKWLAFNDLTF